MKKIEVSSNKNYRFFPIVTALFVTALIISNIISVKLIDFFGITLPAAVILFPFAYIFGDILTEVYGYAKARQVIWIGFFCNLLAVVAIMAGGLLPAASFWTINGFTNAQVSQQAYLGILGAAPRLLLASFISYLVGEFLNSYVLAKLKVATQGKYLWLRTISSTIVGEGVDSIFFISIAFLGTIPVAVLLPMIIAQWIFKVSYEVIATPLTYLAVNNLKRIEQEDFYDQQTDFNPVAF